MSWQLWPSRPFKPSWLSWPYWPLKPHGYCDRPGHRNQHGYCDRPGHQNRHSWLSWLPWPFKPTFMAIVTALAIETDIYSYCDRPGYWNRHGYCDRPGHQNQHGYRDRPGHRNRHSWLLWPPWPSKPTWLSWPYWSSKPTSNIRNSFQDSLRGIVHVSFIHVEVAKIVTSLLRRCLSLARDTLSRSDLSCYSWKKWYDSGFCEPCWQRWGYSHRWLGWSLSGLACDLSDAASFYPSESLSWRSRHSQTTRDVGARSVGARLEDAKRKMWRTRLEDHGLTSGTWPWWYKPDDYLIGNVNLSLWGWREVGG